MAQKSKGMRRKTRKKLTREETGGEISSHLQSFDEGERVRLKIDPAVQQGMPHPRFDGRTAEVRERKGRSYVVALDDGGKEKRFAVYPAHLVAAED